MFSSPWPRIFSLGALFCLLCIGCSKTSGKYIDSTVTDKIIVNISTEEEVLTLLGPCDERGWKDGIEVLTWYYIVSDVRINTVGYQPRVLQSVEVYFHENGTVKRVARFDGGGR